MKIKRAITSFAGRDKVVQIGEVTYFAPKSRGSTLRGFDFSITPEGLFREVEQVFKLACKDDVRQLSFLLVLLFGARPRISLFDGKDHKRLPHMRGVGASGNIVLHNNKEAIMRLLPVLGFKEGRAGWNSFRNTVLTGLTSHDGLGVGGGDGIKFIDSEAMDEDALYYTQLRGRAWKRFRDERSINVELLLDMIQGNGLAGRMLDTFDKADYIWRDCIEYLRIACGCEPGRSLPQDDQIASLVFEDAGICALWKSATVIDGQFVITDHRRLARFLRLRAMMFNQVYNHKDSRSGEVIICQCIGGSMYRQGLLNARELMRCTDTKLERKMGRYLGSPNFLEHICSVGYPKVEEHDSLESALHSFKLVDEDVDTIARVEKFKMRTSCGTDKFMTKKDDRIGTFADLYPDDSEVIRDLIISHKPYRLSIGKLSSMGVPVEHRQRIKSAMSVVPLVL